MRCSYGELMMDRARLRNLQSVQRLGRNRGLLALLSFSRGSDDIEMSSLDEEAEQGWSKGGR